MCIRDSPNPTLKRQTSRQPHSEIPGFSLLVIILISWMGYRRQKSSHLTQRMANNHIKLGSKYYTTYKYSHSFSSWNRYTHKSLNTLSAVFTLSSVQEWLKWQTSLQGPMLNSTVMITQYAEICTIKHPRCACLSNDSGMWETSVVAPCTPTQGSSVSTC